MFSSLVDKLGELELEIIRSLAVDGVVYGVVLGLDVGFELGDDLTLVDRLVLSVRLVGYVGDVVFVVTDLDNGEKLELGLLVFCGLNGFSHD